MLALSIYLFKSNWRHLVADQLTEFVLAVSCIQCALVAMGLYGVSRTGMLAITPNESNHAPVASILKVVCCVFVVLVGVVWVDDHHEQRTRNYVLFGYACLLTAAIAVQLYTFSVSVQKAVVHITRVFFAIPLFSWD